MINWKIFSQVLLIFLLLGSTFIYLRYIEKTTLFHPERKIETNPKEIGLDFQDIFFKTPDNLTLNGWFIPAKNAQYTILFCPGNAGNISHRLDKIKFFNDLGCNIFIFDYRGYGRSKGRPSEKGLYIDVKSAYDYLLSRPINAQQIIGFGESLGGAIIIDLAFKNKMRALIVENTFSNAKDMAKFIYPFIPYWIFSSRLDSLGKIKSIGIPKFMVYSLDDEVVPYKLSKKLYEAAPAPKEFMEIRGGHNDSFIESAAFIKKRIGDFLYRLSKYKVMAEF